MTARIGINGMDWRNVGINEYPTPSSVLYLQLRFIAFQVLQFIVMRFNKQHFVIGDNRNMNISSSSRSLEDTQPVSKAQDDDTGTVESLKRFPSRTRRAQQSVQRHWQRFWCIYAIAGIIFLAIFLPVLYVHHLGTVDFRSTCIPLTLEILAFWWQYRQLLRELLIAQVSLSMRPRSFTRNLKKSALHFRRR